MNLLLDTHVFLWFISGDKKLPSAWRDMICDAHNQVFLSAASVWESIIKHQLGKLPLPAPPESYIPAHRIRHDIASVAIEEADVAQIAQLPPLHRDPFDRIIVAQAQRRGMSLMSVDEAVKAYPVQLVPLS
jgi:PIN domain nuclease of toxin-antitoxin system